MQPNYPSTTRADARFVFEQWHQHIKSRDAARLAELYAYDAELESPLVPRVLDIDTGLLRGQDAIRRFLLEVTRRRPDELTSLYRTGHYTFDGRSLMWEYPRHTPIGEQLDLVEIMELDGKKIIRHRIYWGWLGTQHLLHNALNKQCQP